jgi:D-sedoheptulose 7-phosphate isomerase
MNPTTFAAVSARFSSVLAGIEASVDARAQSVDQAMAAALDLLATLRDQHGSVLIIGNGGSAAVAAHIQNDLVNKGRLRAQVLHEPSLMSCMSNDYGYEQAFSRLVGHYARPGDVLIAISSSGQSANILAAVEAADQAGASVLTLSGFSADNRLRRLGRINFWSPSADYGEVEISHLFVLHALADALAERA